MPEVPEGSRGRDLLTGGYGLLAGGSGAGGGVGALVLGRFLWLGWTRGMALSGTTPPKIFSLSCHQCEMVRRGIFQKLAVSLCVGARNHFSLPSGILRGSFSTQGGASDLHFAALISSTSSTRWLIIHKRTSCLRFLVYEAWGRVMPFGSFHSFSCGAFGLGPRFWRGSPFLVLRSHVSVFVYWWS